MTKHIFLIGHPVGHSISPAFQQRAIDYWDMDAKYEALDVDESDLPLIIDNLRDSQVLGANVTVPYKEAVLPLLDKIGDEVLRIGAVNTIQNIEGTLVGFNTDVIGFSRALKEDGKFDAVGKTALILGSGGSARAVTVALMNSGCKHIIVANRSMDRARILIDSLGQDQGIMSVMGLDSESLSSVIGNIDILVNCTPIGMTGSSQQGRCPITFGSIPDNVFVYDLIYNPQETPLLRLANSSGARVLGGLPMLIYQGAEAFEIWTGKRAPVTQMFQTAYRSLYV